MSEEAELEQALKNLRALKTAMQRPGISYPDRQKLQGTAARLQARIHQMQKDALTETDSPK